jgi:hypothetical protein
MARLADIWLVTQISGPHSAFDTLLTSRPANQQRRNGITGTR